MIILHINLTLLLRIYLFLSSVLNLLFNISKDLASIFIINTTINDWHIDKIYLLLKEVKFDKYKTSLSRYFILSSFLPEKEQVKLI